MYAPFCLMWTIWLERNRRTFQDVAISVMRLKNMFLAILLSWVSGRVNLDVYSFLDSFDIGWLECGVSVASFVFFASP